MRDNLAPSLISWAVRLTEPCLDADPIHDDDVASRAFQVIDVTLLMKCAPQGRRSSSGSHFCGFASLPSATS